MLSIYDQIKVRHTQLGKGIKEREKKENNMPQGPGTYKKPGRPKKKKDKKKK